MVDKDIPGLISPLKNMVNHWYPSLLNSKRAATNDIIIQAFLKEGIQAYNCFPNPSDAYRYAISNAEDGDLIVVYGSFLMVSGVWELFQKQK